MNKRIAQMYGPYFIARHSFMWVGGWYFKNASDVVLPFIDIFLPCNFPAMENRDPSGCWETEVTKGLEIGRVWASEWGECLLRCPVTQSCLQPIVTFLSSSPGSVVHGISQARETWRGCHSLLRDLPTQGLNPFSPSLSLAGRFFTAELVVTVNLGPPLMYHFH